MLKKFFKRGFLIALCLVLALSAFPDMSLSVFAAVVPSAPAGTEISKSIVTFDEEVMPTGQSVVPWNDGVTSDISSGVATEGKTLNVSYTTWSNISIYAYNGSTDTDITNWSGIKYISYWIKTGADAVNICDTRLNFDNRLSVTDMPKFYTKTTGDIIWTENDVRSDAGWGTAYTISANFEGYIAIALDTEAFNVARILSNVSTFYFVYNVGTSPSANGTISIDNISLLSEAPEITYAPTGNEISRILLNYDEDSTVLSANGTSYDNYIGGNTGEISSEYASSGNSMKITFSSWSNARLYAFKSTAPYKMRNWVGAEYLAFWIKNDDVANPVYLRWLKIGSTEMTKDLTLGAYYKTTNSQTWEKITQTFQEYIIPAGFEGTIAIRLKDTVPLFDLNEYMFFFANDGYFTGSVYVDDIGIMGSIDFSNFNISLDANSNKMVSKIQRETNVDTFISTLPKATGVTLEIKNTYGATISGQEKIGTGTTIAVTALDGTVSTYTSIIFGDTTGDGAIGISDLAEIKSHLLKISLLTDNKLLAASINNQGRVTISDLLAIKKQILNISEINQG